MKRVRLNQVVGLIEFAVDGAAIVRKPRDVAFRNQSDCELH